MGIQGKSLLQAGSAGGEAIARILKMQVLLSTLSKAFAQKTRAALVALAPEDREVFRAHLVRLDERTRLERFGNVSLEDGFFERYVQNLNFENTLLLGVTFDGVLRASAELRSLHRCWASEAELAIIVERDWQDLGPGMVLLRSAISCAEQLGVTELFLHCHLESERPVSFLRLLGKELRSATPLRLTALDLIASRDDESRATDGLIRLGLESSKNLAG